ncbi:antitoxin VapB family protein [Halorubellus salinus]|uniref:antitoxin VapB family protein n=1 Tax=Halorubellus salinus TaxID=755309 RepID=UPI001D06A418|nr:antitoxin VapB family protein [Halorubellus salinus]
MPSDDATDREPRTIAVSERVHDHLQAMGMPDESANETLERLLGLSPDPATVDADPLSTPLPDDPVVPDALATDPTTDATAVEPEEIPEPEVAPADVDAALGELAAVLDPEDRERTEALLERIADADPAELDGIVATLEDERDDEDDADADADASDRDDA